MCVLPTPQGKAYTYLSVLKTGASSDLLAERHLVELVQHRLVEPFAKAVGLRRFGFCLGVVDIVDRQVAEDLQERRVDFSVDVSIVSQAGTAVRTLCPRGGYRMFPAPALRRPMPLPARLPPQLNVVLHFAGQVRATADLKSCLQSGTGVELQAETQRL